MIDVNRTILEQYKLRKEDLLGKSMADLIGEDLPLVSLFFAAKKVRLGEEIYCQLRQEILRIEDSVYILWRLKDVSQEKELKILTGTAEAIPRRRNSLLRCPPDKQPLSVHNGIRGEHSLRRPRKGRKERRS
ncbi:MAG: hypothetical protein Q9N34_00815 [Aquificota bacterium]|nr:hypothetical protein [Aquificota bacterium]